VGAAFPLRAAALSAAVPLAVLLALVALGHLGVWPAIAATVVVFAGSVALAQLWTHDLRLVMSALQWAGSKPAADPPNPPFLTAAAHLAREAERLSRSLAMRTAQVEGLLRAEQVIVQRLPDPLIVLGPDRRVQRANAAAHAAFGGEMAAVLRHPGLRAAIDRAQSQGADQVAELSLPVPVAREVCATVMALDPPLSDGGRIVAVLSDRTRERAVERMRADFVANASHELRTPLASLIGFIDTLRGPAADDPPAQTRFLGVMAEQAQRMNRLIDDLLSLSRIELTEHQLPATRVNLGDLIHRLAAGFEPQVAARRIRLAVSVPPSLPRVLGDDDQLEQVLQNLLDNAVKYGREGGVVTVSVGRAMPGGRWPGRPGVTLSVADDGQGIARAHIPRLTERFYRADKGRSRAVGGTGLGLAIVKHIVNRHRGQMLIESHEGAGTTVTIWLPEGEAAETAAAAPA
jgi:two-component system phosphate regulon sensor histidine kinase PhoR